MLEALEACLDPNYTSLLNCLARRAQFQNGETPSWGDIESLFHGRKLEDSSSLTICASGDQEFALSVTVKQSSQIQLGSSPLFLECRTSQATWQLHWESEKIVLRNPVKTQVQTYPEMDFVPFGDPKAGQMALQWDAVVRREGEADVLRLLQVLEPRLRKISFSAEAYQGKASGILLFFDGESTPQSLSPQGDGFKKLLRLAISWASHPNGVILIDEIEAGLHYRTLRLMWSLLFAASRNLGIQFFVTTHSLDCLEALVSVMGETDGCAAVGYRLRQGAQRPVRYSSEELISAVNSKIEVR